MNYKKVKLGDISTVSSSKRIFARQYVTSGVPFYRQKEILDKKDKKEITEPLYISQDTYNDIKKKFGVPQKGDLLITAVGVTLGIPYIVEDELFYFKDGNLIWLKDFDKDINSRYLYYWITSDNGQKLMWSRTIGSAQPALTIDIVKQIEISLPNYEKQCKIVNILSVYDNLLENNGKQIKLLEEAAQRLYKEWFVDLRFPGHEDVEVIDSIPSGWRIGTVNEVVEYHDKKRKPLSAMQREKFKGKYRYYGAAGILDYVENYIFDGTYLLLGEDGSVITFDGKPILQYVTGKFWVNNHAHVLTGKGVFTTEYIYMMFSNMGISDVVTGVAQPKISQARLSAKKIIIPNNNIVELFNVNTKAFFDKILVLERQNKRIIEARDRLLPKLMSGEVEV